MNRAEAIRYLVKFAVVISAVAAGWWLFNYSLRVIAIPYFVLAIIASSFWIFGKNIKWALGLWLAFVVASYSPVDFSLANKPGPPRLVPMVMGYHTTEAKMAAERSELFLGGCLVNGHEPKWVVVW